MIMRAFLAEACFGSVLLFATASWAATPEPPKATTPEAPKVTTLQPVKGDVWINHGKGFVKVDQPIEATVGDSIMVSPGGYAKVTYADKCETNVKPGAVMTITQLSPCASGSLAADLTPHPYYKAPVAAPAEFVPWWFWVPFVVVPPFLVVCIVASEEYPPRSTCSP
jgi:hypothetical protein